MSMAVCIMCRIQAKLAELELARQQVQTQKERILLLEQQLAAQQDAAQQAAREATHNQALLLNKLALLMSEDALHAWLLGVGMLEPEEHDEQRRHKRGRDADVQEEEQGLVQHRRRRRRLFGLL